MKTYGLKIAPILWAYYSEDGFEKRFYQVSVDYAIIEIKYNGYWVNESEYNKQHQQITSRYKKKLNMQSELDF
ncbi:MAG: hypothetical protein ACXW1B_06220 [Nitrososphaeraceae archaeon]